MIWQKAVMASRKLASTRDVRYKLAPEKIETHNLRRYKNRKYFAWKRDKTNQDKKNWPWEKKQLKR